MRERVLRYILFIVTEVVAGLTAVADATPDPTATGIIEADKLYAEKEYKKAIPIYEEVMQINGVSAPLLYNLGNACYKAGENGKAVLAYERALKLDPGNKEIKNNLSYVRTRIDDQNKSETKGHNITVTPDAPSFFSGVYSNITTETSSNYWALFAAFSFVLFIGSVSLYVFTRNVNARKCGFFGSLLFLGFCIIFLVFAFSASKEYYSKDSGIVTAYKTELLTEPLASSKPSTTALHCGTRLTVLDTKTDSKGEVSWYKVRLNSEYLGWISSDAFELI